MRGTSKDTLYPYVLECERGEKEETQTTFWVSVLGGFDDGDVAAGYQSAMKTTRGGNQKIDRDKWKSASRENWVNHVKKVTNWWFSKDYFDTHGKDVIEDTTDANMIADIGRDLTLEPVQEIMEYVRNASEGDSFLSKE